MSTDFAYNAGKANLLRSASAWDAGVFKILGIGTLPTVPSALYNPDLPTIAAILGLSGIVECAGTGYSRLTLGSKTISEDDTNDRAALGATGLVYPSANGWTLQSIVVYVDGASDALRYPVFHFNSGLPLTAIGSNLSYSFNPVGLATAA